MFAELVRKYHLHPIADHFTIALLTFGVAAELLSAAAALFSRGRTGSFSAWSQKLRSTSLLLIISGAAASVLSSLSQFAGVAGALLPAMLGSRFGRWRRCRRPSRTWDRRRG